MNVSYVFFALLPASAMAFCAQFKADEALARELQRQMDLEEEAAIRQQQESACTGRDEDRLAPP